MIPERMLSRRGLLALCLVSTLYFLTQLSNSHEFFSGGSSKAHPSAPPKDDNDFRHLLASVRPTDKLPHSRTLGIADAIFVISLARRLDRKATMDSIAEALDLDFTYVDATDYKTPRGRRIIDNLRDRVRWQRQRIDDREARPSDWPTPDHNKSDTFIMSAFPFKWSDDVEDNKDAPLANPLGVYGADYWDLDPPNEEWEKTHPLPPWTEEERNAPIMEASVLNNQHRLVPLRDAGFACWHSHHRTLREIERRKLKSAIIFEDDIDIEWNVERILRKQWSSLPDDWDIVYLGHCWSEEWRGEMLPGAPMLRKSFHTLCNHAYVVSLAGATKMLRYFRSPDYAYSRPVDHGYKDLIQMHKLVSVSVYPPVAVQTKTGLSDIVGTIETTWKRKEGLVDSTLERVELYKNMTAESIVHNKDN